MPQLTCFCPFRNVFAFFLFWLSFDSAKVQLLSSFDSVITLSRLSLTQFLLTISNQFLTNFRHKFDQFSTSIRSIFKQFLINFRAIFDQFSTSFRTTYDQFWPIFDMNSSNFQPKFDQFLTDFWWFFDQFLINFQPIFDQFSTNLSTYLWPILNQFSIDCVSLQF